MLGRALCRLARELPDALDALDALPTRDQLSHAEQDRLGIVCPVADPADPVAAALTQVMSHHITVSTFGIREAPDAVAGLLLAINRAPVACYVHLGGVAGEHSTNTFIIVHTFLRNCNPAGAPAAYIADVQSPGTLWERPQHRREWERGRRAASGASVASAAPSASAAHLGVGWNVWQAPRRVSSSSSSSSSDESSDESSEESGAICGHGSPRTLLREYMQRPNLRAFAAFVHGGTQAMCQRLAHDGRRPDLVFLDTGCGRCGSRRTLRVLGRDFDVMHALHPRCIIVGGIRQTSSHHGARLWSDVQQLACYDALVFGDFGLLCRRQ